MTIMAISFINVISSADVANATHKQVVTLAGVVSKLVKASEALMAVKDGKDKRALFQRLAGIARIDYIDAVALIENAQAYKDAFKPLRSGIVARIKDASVIHDAQEDAATIVAIDKCVSAFSELVKASNIKRMDVAQAT